MSELIAHTMFHNVLFPKDATSGGADMAAEALTLRRLKRFVPSPSLDLRDCSIVIFDLETTGLDPDMDRIIEIGGIKLSGLEMGEEFSSLVSTDVELTDDIVRMTGITPEMLVGQPSINEVLPRFLDFIGGAILVAHNAEFDVSMLKAACSRLGTVLEWPCFCTLKMARELLPQLENKKLDTLAQHYGLSFEARHRAIGDIKVTAGVLSGLMSREASHLRLWSHVKPYTVEMT